MAEQKQRTQLCLVERQKTKSMKSPDTHFSRISTMVNLTFWLLLLSIFSSNAQTFNETYLSNGEVAGQTVTEITNGFSIATTSLTTKQTASFGTITTDLDGQLTGTTNVATIQRTGTGETIKTKDGQFLKVQFNGTTINLTKESGLGNLTWTKAFAIPNVASIYNARLIQNDAQENFIVGLVRDMANDGYGYVVIKTDINGTLLWMNNPIFIGDNSFQITFVTQMMSTQQGGLVFSYSTFAGGFQTGVRVVRLDNNGTLQFEKIYDGGGQTNIGIDALAEGPNQSTFIVQFYQGSKGPVPRSVTLENIAVNGSTNWQKSINNELPSFVPYPSLVNVGAINFINNGIVVIGQLDEGGPNYRNLVFTMRFQANGTLDWVNDNLGFEAEANFVDGTSDGGYIVTGSRDNQVWLMKTNGQGNLTPVNIGPDCADINLTVLGNAIEISGLTAPIEIVEVYDENWQQVFRCQGEDCGTEQAINDLANGTHYVKIQFYNENWVEICRFEQDITVVGPPQGCDALYLIDYENDFCSTCVGEVATYEFEGKNYFVHLFDNVNCVDGGNDIFDCETGELFCTEGGFSPQPSTCNDFFANATKLETIWSKATDCGTSPSCDDVEIVLAETFAPTPGIATYDIIGLTAPIEIVKIFNRNTYEKIYECNNDCGNDFNIELQEGQYVLQIQMYTENWEWICGKDIEFDVNPTNLITCSFLTQALLDGLCTDFCVSEVATYSYQGNTYYAFLADNVNCSDAQTIVYSCANGSQFCASGGITGSTECATFFAQAQKITTVWKRADDCPSCPCPAVINPVCGSDGVTYDNSCLAECAGIFSWTAGACPSTNPDCDNVTAKLQIGIQNSYEGLGVEGLNTPIEIVKIYDQNWNKVYECAGNCANPTVLPLSNISAGLYRVHVQMYTANWQWICETDFLEVTVPSNAGFRTSGSYIDEKSITLFPNPVMHTLQLSTKNLSGKKGSIQIFNAFGQQVADFPQKEFNQTYETIDVSSYQNGLYYLHIKAEKMQTISKKFLVEKME